MSLLSVALLGYGVAGRLIHGPLLRATPGLAVRTIVVRDPGRRQQAAADFPEAQLLSSAGDVWSQRPRSDLVVIATPSGTHLRLAGEAIDVGIPAVVDKPLATNAADARRLVTRASAQDVLLVPFHNRRWDSDQLTLKMLLGEGLLGEVYRYESRFERWRPHANPQAWRESLGAAEGGGILLDLGIHLVDQALELFGPVIRVTGELESRRGGAEDDAFIAIEHRSGTRSHLWASAVAAAPGPRLRVLGSGAAFVMHHLDGQEAALRAGMSPRSAEFGSEPPERWGRLVRGDDTQSVPSQPGGWRHFYPAIEQALRAGAQPPVSGDDAVAALEVLDQVRATGPR